MIDPHNVINYNRTDSELEEFIIFCVCVAGKKSSTIAPRVSELFSYLKCVTTEQQPLKWYMDLPNHNTLSVVMKFLGIGCYQGKAQTILDIANHISNLRTCSLNELMAIKGIGAKTARMFLNFTREDANYAVLDVHSLRFLRREGVENVPKSTPIGKKYLDLEQIFLKMVPEDTSATRFDLKNWSEHAKPNARAV